MTDAADLSRASVRLMVSTPAELLPLRDWMRRAPRVSVELIQEQPGRGELGVGDVLQISSTIGGGTAGLLLALRTLPEFIRSRRSNIKVTVTSNEREVVLEASNVDDIMPILDHHIFDDRRTKP